MKTINVRNGLNGVNLSIEEVQSRLGVDIELKTSLITGHEYYVFTNIIKESKTNNRFTKKNIKSKLEKIDKYDLEWLIENNEVSNIDELVSLIYKTNYKPSRKSNYDITGVRLSNHSNMANYGSDNSLSIKANLIFDK